MNKVKELSIGLGTLGALIIGFFPRPVFANDLAKALKPIIEEQMVARNDRAHSKVMQQRILISLKRTEKYDFIDHMSQNSIDKRRLEELEDNLKELETMLEVLLEHEEDKS